MAIWQWYIYTHCQLPNGDFTLITEKFIQSGLTSFDGI